MQDGVPAPDPTTPRRRTSDPSRQHVRHAGRGRVPPRLHDQRAVLRHRDFSIIDYVGGLEDLRAGIVRSIGDPEVRLQGRSGADAPRGRARRAPRLHDRAADPRRDPRASPRDRARARRRGCSRSTTRSCAPDRRRRRSAAWPTSGLLEPISPELHRGADRAALALARRARRLPPRGSTSTPDTLHERDPARQPARAARPRAAAGPRRRSIADDEASDRRRPAGPRLGELPLARRDVERLRQILVAAAAAARSDAPARGRSARSTHRSIFREALTWLEIHGGAPELVEHWKALAGRGAATPDGRRRRRESDAAARPRRRRTPPPAPRRRHAEHWTVRGLADATRGRAADGCYAAAISSIVLYGLASRSEISSLMTGQAGSISLARKLNFGLRGYPWWLLCSPSPPVSSASEADVGRGVVEVLVADVVAEPVDRRRQHEHVHHGVNAGREQTPADAEHERRAARCRRRAEQAVVEEHADPTIVLRCRARSARRRRCS